MKRWLGLVIAWVGVVCLLLSLPHPASLIHDLHAGGDRSVGRWRESVAASSPALLATSTESIRSRAGPFQSFAANMRFGLPKMLVHHGWTTEGRRKRAVDLG